MLHLYRMFIKVCWGLGLVSTVIAVLLKLAPTLAKRFHTEPHAGLIFAGVLFLCALATREMERAASPSS